MAALQADGSRQSGSSFVIGSQCWGVGDVLSFSVKLPPPHKPVWRASLALCQHSLSNPAWSYVKHTGALPERSFVEQTKEEMTPPPHVECPAATNPGGLGQEEPAGQSCKEKPWGYRTWDGALQKQAEAGAEASRGDSSGVGGSESMQGRGVGPRPRAGKAWCGFRSCFASWVIPGMGFSQPWGPTNPFRPGSSACNDRYSIPGA